MSEMIETKLSDVDGEKGRLTIAGRDVEAFALSATFEDACALLLGGTSEKWQQDLAAARLHIANVQAERSLHMQNVQRENAMDFLRAHIAQLPETTTPAEVIAAVGVFMARFCAPDWRPDPQLSHSADLSRAFKGGRGAAQALDTYFATVCDHGMNASTFTARVIASTQSDLVSAVTGAIGALKGPLHGGAPGPVLDMLDAIGSPPNAAAYLKARLDKDERVMGMGHRIYRVRDPRAAVLEQAIERLQATPRLELARATERVAEKLLAQRHPERRLKANVEFYTAVLLEAAGVPRAAFSAAFATGRVIGWCAHVAEQRSTGRLIRPQSKYTGPTFS